MRMRRGSWHPVGSGSAMARPALLSLAFSFILARRTYLSLCWIAVLPDCTNWRWRTEIVLRDSAKLVLTHYGIGPEGLEWKGVGFNYQKTIEKWSLVCFSNFANPVICLLKNNPQWFG